MMYDWRMFFIGMLTGIAISIFVFAMEIFKDNSND